MLANLFLGSRVLRHDTRRRHDEVGRYHPAEWSLAPQSLLNHWLSVPIRCSSGDACDWSEWCAAAIHDSSPEYDWAIVLVVTLHSHWATTAFLCPPPYANRVVVRWQPINTSSVHSILVHWPHVQCLRALAHLTCGILRGLRLYSPIIKSIVHSLGTRSTWRRVVAIVVGCVKCCGL